MNYELFRTGRAAVMILAGWIAWGLPAQALDELNPARETTVTGKRPSACERDPEFCKPGSTFTPGWAKPPSTNLQGTDRIPRGPSPDTVDRDTDGDCMQLTARKKDLVDVVENLQRDRVEKARDIEAKGLKKKYDELEYDVWGNPYILQAAREKLPSLEASMTDACFTDDHGRRRRFPIRNKACTKATADLANAKRRVADLTWDNKERDRIMDKFVVEMEKDNAHLANLDNKIKYNATRVKNISRALVAEKCSQPIPIW